MVVAGEGKRVEYKKYSKVGGAGSGDWYLILARAHFFPPAVLFSYNNKAMFGLPIMVMGLLAYSKDILRSNLVYL